MSTPTSVQDSQLFPRSCVQAYMRATTLPAHICFDVQCLLVWMDLETENQIASVLLREAAELRRQAEKDGVLAYLEKPNFNLVTYVSVYKQSGRNQWDVEGSGARKRKAQKKIKRGKQQQ
ncbi:hypothetical protein Bca101_043418 [Brassica carinata]